MAEPGRVDLAIEQRVVDRVEHAVADAGDDGADGEHQVARARRVAEGGEREQAEAGEQHRARPEAVDDEARERLHRAGDDEEDRQQHAKLGVADVERLLQPEKERRQ